MLRPCGRRLTARSWHLIRGFASTKTNLNKRPPRRPLPPRTVERRRGPPPPLGSENGEKDEVDTFFLQFGIGHESEVIEHVQKERKERERQRYAAIQATHASRIRKLNANRMSLAEKEAAKSRLARIARRERLLEREKKMEIARAKRAREDEARARAAAEDIVKERELKAARLERAEKKRLKAQERAQERAKERAEKQVAAAKTASQKKVRSEQDRIKEIQREYEALRKWQKKVSLARREYLWNGIPGATPKSAKSSQGSALPAAALYLEDIQAGSTPVHSQDPFTIVSSYNNVAPNEQQDQGVPRIRVPGHAPVLQEVRPPFRVPGDQDTLALSRIPGKRTARGLFDDIFESAAIMNPEIKFNNVHLVATRAVLSDLLLLSQGAELSTLRINLQLVKDTLFLWRPPKFDIEEKPTDDAKAPKYGIGFERAIAKPYPEYRGTSEHIRMIQYKLGDLQCVVKTEVDACKQPEPGNVWTLDPTAAGLPDSEGQGSSPYTIVKELPHIAVEVARNGSRIMPHTAVAEIKTQAMGVHEGLNDLKESTNMQAAWFGRVPWLVVGEHQSGIFRKIEMHHASKYFAAWETMHQESLRKLTTLLTWIRNTMVHRSRGRVCALILRTGNKRLRIFYTTDRQTPVDKTMISKFWSRSPRWKDRQSTARQGERADARKEASSRAEVGDAASKIKDAPKSDRKETHPGRRPAKARKPREAIRKVTSHARESLRPKKRRYSGTKTFVVQEGLQPVSKSTQDTKKRRPGIRNRRGKIEESSK
ncbi:Reticulocyte-binding protein 2-like protein a [Colletotrichum sidae]|uniref:Reticulocyte-binding protein 2-like protein a n=1 Tax=Colletotrichum sidae TaxID=1347389 RepID=A0A4R8TE73_9PEZI|nr:Reticulocyte-binding protein 2-like protein a [Colletotrichum sidae]